MKNTISYIGSPATGVSAIIGGKAYSVTSDNPAVGEIFTAIATGAPADDIIALFDRATAITKFFPRADGNLGGVEVRGDMVFYNGEKLENSIVDRILAFMRDGLPVEPLIAFLNRLMSNPSRRAIQMLYIFLENKSMPITEDGFFLGYKGVNDDYTDRFSGTIDNSVGATPPRLERKDVDDDSRNECSYGYHVGSLDYATSFGEWTVIVKVDPADVVSIPDSNSSWKLRTVAYEVISDFNGPLTAPLYRDAGLSPFDDDTTGTGVECCW